MDAKFFDSLYEGDSANGVKLGMGLTGGDFWARIGGCQNLYRGESANTIDFDTILATGDTNEDSITVPDFINHQAGGSYVYVLRRANICGYEEHTFAAAVKVSLDGQGNLIWPACNDVFALTARQIAGPKVWLLWLYYPIGQGAAPERFNIYWGSGTGEIDYGSALGSVDYIGPRYYGFETGVVSEDCYKFCVRGVMKDGQENEHLGTIRIQIRDLAPQSVETLETKVL
jgi:hypothetical protein